MRLEIGNIIIKNIEFGSVSKIENGTLFINSDEVKKIVLEDEKISNVKVELAKPGESIRITPVKDVVQPRCKVSGRGGIFLRFFRICLPKD